MVAPMNPAVAALWGLVGSLVVEAFDNVEAMRRTGVLPWRARVGRRQVGMGVWCFALVLRTCAGAGTAAACGSGGILVGPLGAFAVGVGGPLALESVMRRVPVSGGSTKGTVERGASGRGEGPITVLMPEAPRRRRKPSAGSKRAPVVTPDHGLRDEELPKERRDAQ